MDGVNPARPKVTRPSVQELHECPGGSHDPIERELAQALSEAGLLSRTVGVAPVGCALLLFESLDIDCVTVPPGRGPTIAAGIKLVHPDAIVFSFQGGWDAASSGLGEVLHAARRGDPVTIVYANLAPARPEQAELPLAELVARIEGAAYVERVVLDGERSLPTLRQAFIRAFAIQAEGAGFTFIEAVSRERAHGRSGCLRDPGAR